MITRYYHYICNKREKEVYAIIYEGLLECKTKIIIEQSILPNRVSELFKMVLYDNPNIFFTSTQDFQIISTARYLILKPRYYFPLNSIIQIDEMIKRKIESICKNIKNINDDFSKEIYIHNYLIENVKYNNTDVAQPINAYTIAGALLEQNAVCAGIALTFKMLMDYLNIPSIVATGIADNGEKKERHAWNLVYIENEYYQIDVTWDLLNEQNERIVKYDYFNLTTDCMYKNRIEDINYPICNSVKYNYFFYTNSIVNSPQEMQKYVMQKIFEGESKIYFKYMFDVQNINQFIIEQLSKIYGLGRYQFWVDENMKTVFLMRI